MKIPALLSCRSLAYAVSMVALFGVHATRADTVASYTSGNGDFSVLYPKGQSFTTVSSTPENDISFNFLTHGSGSAFAAGTGFLYSQPYTGAISALGSPSSTFLGSATANGGHYNFGSSLTLEPGTQYFFYENAFFNDPVDLDYGTTYTGGVVYTDTTSDSTGTFQAIEGTSLDFRVNGSPVPTAAPDTGSTALLLALGAAALFGGARLRQDRQAV